MIKFFSKLLDSQRKQLDKIRPLVEKINSLEEETQSLGEQDFPARTAAFRQRLADGEILDNLLPEAFALAREAIKRVIGERAYDVQLMAAVCLHQGKIAEQKTGEGKTLSAAIAAYLNALPGKGVHIVTVNDYLARRDAGWYGKALRFLGLEVGCIMHEAAFSLDEDYAIQGQVDERLRHLRPVPKRQAYEADVVYGTNNEFGFDYLRDNMAYQKDQLVQRGQNFAIVDEVDFVLIDEARTPLIISAPDAEPTEKYYQATQMIKILSADTDYLIDEKIKTASLTEHGLRKIEKRLGVDNLYEKDFDTIHHLENALRARTLYLKDRDYVVKDGQIVIVDEFTGRLMNGRRWSDGLHQAVEAKEGVKIEQESKTMATISFQNYFRLYEKLSGMTGTAATEAEEFEKIYQLSTIVVPTNLPLARQDQADVIYKTTRAKYAAVVAEIEEKFQQGQPILVGTTSIEKNQILDSFLDKKGIPHQVLNAKNHEREAKIIADAGRKKAVTVATNLAGRGVDIVLGGAKPENPTKTEIALWQKDHDEVVSLGGLHVIGTERHESRRIDNQLRGRAGRQGDPGSSRFYVALDDDIMRLFGGERIARLMTVFKLPEDQPLEHKMVSRAIEQAQVRVESFHFDARKRVVEYDDVMNRQREVIYGRRHQLLEGVVLKDGLFEAMEKEVENLVEMYAPEGFAKAEIDQIVNSFCEILPLESESQKKLKKALAQKSPAEIKNLLEQTLTSAYRAREKQLGEENLRQVERMLSLMVIDRLWVDHLDSMDDLREGIGLRGYGQLDPLVEYKKEAFGAFEALLKTIDTNVIKRIFRVQVGTPPQFRSRQNMVESRGQMPEIQTQTSSSAQTSNAGLSFSQSSVTGSAVEPVVSGRKKIGRNEPCWCGSGKKYKKCHYPQPSPN
ncbi:MAG: preprotein translocase subunit SecA [Candidatus Pacebacteria bacterium]|nr:preprotein translocase subunit SecA [Candidatus Paceibacterota bacterium]